VFINKGNELPRNAVRMPSIFNNDLAFFKNIKLGERREIQLRWDIYNIFNPAISGTSTGA